MIRQRPITDSLFAWVRLCWNAAVKLSRRTTRILDYLWSQIERERDVWLRDDLYIAFQTVRFAAEGCTAPFVAGFTFYLGKPPHKLIPLFVARAEAHASSQRKPAGSVRGQRAREVKEGGAA